MTSKQKIDKLVAFKHRNKFSTQAWNERGLNSSSDDFCKRLTDFFNSCADKMIDGINNKLSDEQIEHLLETELIGLNKTGFDTEEKEFICELFYEMASFINVNINDVLEKWLYGYVLKQQEKILETIKQPCTKCEIELETHIKEKQEGILETGWLLAKCNNCGELNLLSNGNGIKRASFGNYQWLGTLRMDKYNYEQALTRLEQIKLLKKIEYRGNW